MPDSKVSGGIKRRDFLKAGLIGTSSALIGMSSIAEAVDQIASLAPFEFPKPVYRTLGRTGMKITIVSFGAMLTPESEVIRIAFDSGVNYVDTARRYMGGNNEEIVGKALKGMRQKVFVASKTLPTSTSKEDIIRDVETSLKALGTDYIDVIQLHNLTDKERIFMPETREALTRLRRDGKVRFFGVTTHKNQAEVLNALVDDKERFFDTALVAYNFKSDKDVSEAIARASQANIGIVAMKTQQGGYETTAMGKISHHQSALKWALQNRHVTAAIPGMKDISQLKEDISVMGMPFSYVDRRIMERYSAAVESYYCSLCGKCEGSCPLSVEISDINRSLMYAEGYRNGELALSTYQEIPAKVSASACLDCSGCVAECVRGLDIAQKMNRARIIFA